MAVPKIFQTFNSLLGSIVRKKNATIVGPSKQLVGEFPPVTFERLYEYYHGWDQIKRSVDTMHQKFMGAGVEIKSNNEYFNIFMDKWWDTANAAKKWSQFFYSILITGNGIMELQYTTDGRVGNIEHIPMQTIFRIFRDQFANELKLVQVVDGVFKELDPQFFIHWMINNPDRQAFGKSEFHSLAAPRPVASKVDPFTGQAVNPDRNIRPLLDSQAILQNAEVEIKEKMGKPRLLVSAAGMPRDQMKEVQAEMADPNTDQYIWIFDKPLQSTELAISSQTKFDDYGDNVDSHIDIGTGFASKVVSNPGGFSYSSSQTPFDVLDQRMVDLQIEASEMIKDKLIKPIAESWGFKEFEEMEVEVTFMPTIRRMTMEDIQKLPIDAVSPEEKREILKKLHIPLDDQLWDEFQNEMKKDKDDQKNIQMTGAQMGGFGQGTPFGGGGKGEGGGPPTQSPTGGESPTSPGSPTPKSPGGMGGSSGGGKPKMDPEHAKQQPFPQDKVPQPPLKKKKGEALTADDIGTIVEKTVKALAKERIPLPPSATDSSNQSTDLYVSQGLDTPGVPEITDPEIRSTYGLDEDEFEDELPPNAPQRRADLDNPPNLDPEGGTGRLQQPHQPGEFPQVSVDDYVGELENKIKGDSTKGGTGNDGIDDQSTGDFKDPDDRQGLEIPEDTSQQATQSTKVGPTERDTMIPLDQDKPQMPDLDDDSFTRSMTGGSQAQPDNTKKQELGSFDNDISPIVPQEGDPAGDSALNKEKKIYSQDLRAKGKRTQEAIAKELGEKPQPQIPDKPETYHRDKVKPEDSDPRLPMEDPNPDLNQEQKGQARLDDHPLFEEPSNDPQGISPSRDRVNQGTPNAFAEEPNDLKNDVNQAGGTGNAVEPVIGQSDQERLHRDELVGDDEGSKLPTIGEPPLDNTGLNMEPDPYKVNDQYDDKTTGVKDALNEKPDLQNPTLEDPLGNVPNDDGMLFKPEDVQQVTPPNKDFPEPGADPEMGQNVDQGVDPNEINPEELHEDPKTGVMYTDQTDEQGNEVPDLRMDQTPDSDEKQPEVELENEIVTKEEYDIELEKSRGSDPTMQGLDPNMQDPTQQDGNAPPVTEDEFNAELEKKSTDPEEKNPFEQKTESPLEKEPESPLEKEPESPLEEKPLEKKPEVPQKGDSQKSETPKKEPEESSEPKEKPKPKPKEKRTDDKPKKSAPKKNGDKKKPTSSGQEKPTKDEKPDQSKKDKATISKPKEEATDLIEDEPKNITGSVSDIIEREHELMDANVPEETAHKLLEDEFGEEIADDAFEEEELQDAEEVDSMRTMSDQVHVRPDGKVIGKPFKDKRKRRKNGKKD